MELGFNALAVASNNVSFRNSVTKNNPSNANLLFKDILVGNNIRNTLMNKSTELEDTVINKDLPDDYLTIMNELQKILNEDTETSHSYSKLLEILINLDEELSLDNMNAILDTLELSGEDPNKEVNFSSIDFSFTANTLMSVNQEQMKQLLVKIDHVLQSITKGSFSFDDYKQLMNNMKEWIELQKIDQKSAQELLDSLKEPQKKLWGELIDKYTQKIKQDNMYTNQNQLTYDTVSKWVKDAMLQVETAVKGYSDVKVDNSSSALPTTNMSRIEQFVIHTQQTNATEQVSQKQLIEQFQQIFQKSNFLKGPNGANQLFIRLQPEHLGDVVIKLTQVNGEMVVKMVVQSQMAKEMLEGNLQQLRHMFSPQQVVIEKQEVVMSQNESDSFSNDEKESSNQNEHQSNDDFYENEAIDYDDELDFSEILMDMKV